MRGLFSFCFLIFMLLLHCIKSPDKGNSIQAIDIGAGVTKMQRSSLSQFTDDILYTKLEFLEESQIDLIRSISVSEKYILISDRKFCYLFDTKGKFLRKIGKVGRGPGEYQFLTDALLLNDRIYIQSVFDMFEYKTDGSFVRKIKDRFMFNNNKYEYTRNWIYLNDLSILCHIPNPTGSIRYKALITDNSRDIIKSYPNHIYFSPVKPITITEDNAHIYRFGQRIYFKEYYNDTLFYLDEKYNLIPEYVFKLGKYKEPVDGREKPIAEWGESQSRYIFIPMVFQTEKFLFIKCQFRDNFPAKRLTPKLINLPDGSVLRQWYNTTYILGIWNKQKRVLSLCNPSATDNPLVASGIYNDIDAGPNFFPETQISNSTMAMWVTAHDLKAHVASNEFKKGTAKYPEKKKKLEELAASLSDYDNPVLMFVKLKE